MPLDDGVDGIHNLFNVEFAFLHFESEAIVGLANKFNHILILRFDFVDVGSFANRASRLQGAVVRVKLIIGLQILHDCIVHGTQELLNHKLIEFRFDRFHFTLEVGRIQVEFFDLFVDDFLQCLFVTQELIVGFLGDPFLLGARQNFLNVGHASLVQHGASFALDSIKALILQLDNDVDLVDVHD